MFFYLHIPFCRQKCLYCKFALTPKFDELKIRTYIDALKREMVDFFALNPGVGIETIYFGGGTPSILTRKHIDEILEIFRRQEGFVSPSEVTLEANPEDISEDYLVTLSELWINRLSLGIQTLNSESLQMVGRADSNEYIFRALQAIAKGPIENISIDLIAGLPSTVEWQVTTDLAEIFRFVSPKHVSIYMLEDETYPKNWKKHLPSEEMIRSEYLSGVGWLKAHGLDRYELSNFAKPGFESKHNQAYWNHSPYRGFWLSAASFTDGKRYTNHTSFGGYYQGKKETDVLSLESLRIERMMFGLRTSWISLDEAGNDSKLDVLVQEGLLEKRQNKVFPTSTWIFLIDYIISELI